jgi:peptide/nickel transport system permease protein
MTEPATISGIDVMRGVGAARARGFWADAWGRVMRQHRARFALAWIGVVAFFAVFAPLVANSHPVWLRVTRADGSVATSWPLLDSLTATDILLLCAALVGVPLAAWPVRWLPRAWRGAVPPAAERARVALVTGVMAGLIVVVSAGVLGWLGSAERSSEIRGWVASGAGTWWVAGGVALVFACAAAPLRTCRSRRLRLAAVAVVAALAMALVATRSATTLVNYDTYLEPPPGGRVEAVWTLIPWGPDFSRTDLYTRPPGTRVADLRTGLQNTPLAGAGFVLGTDAVGKDVLSQMLWACRLSISIGLVSTGISLMIGITLGALAGYYGGKFDLLLYRLVEIFMAIPVLFLLIVAAGVLPRNIYVMMALIGCVGWTGAARFTRAEFLKLRNQDFVQAAKALGLPLRSILFKHMLPNGVTPVLVDASFAVAAAILAEATLSYLGLGPDGQPSWGKLLSNATGETGTFIWWLAIFPGLAIFLTVLAYNMLGEELRDAIDPKLRKAAH